ncbi:sarcosine oxidase subunit gamma [Jannaschia sp. CCS1]|uniref:sarcosine oxidase subunit gamma n=1 Tax=Jannaschia sp. (strain CCS1) TaxID=290400 RepID=UPI000053B2A6|nr:sarcosine oxidase subunit gamma [Jannaschia sp. CCS1]ABD56365.1 Sarcosine oxidase gamma subunit [Jannaschia sp. CCS1]
MADTTPPKLTPAKLSAAKLTARTPFAGLLPISEGATTLSEVTHDAITWISPAKGKMATVSKALAKQTGASFPDPGRIEGAAVWSGPGQALLLGPTFKPIKGAAASDQSSAWACCALNGPDARAVLARLVPIDLRPESFAEGHVARTLLGHMNCVLLHRSADRYEIMVFRSMATTAAHEIAEAMALVAARSRHL